MDIRIPKLGEGVSAGTVVSILVKEGDRVKKEQTVLELETEKAVAPIPSPADGVIGKILVKEGQSVPVGGAIMTLSSAGSGSGEAPKTETSAPAKPSAPSYQPPVQTSSTAPSQDYAYESKSGFAPPASPTVRRLAQDLGIDLTRVRGSEAGGRVVVADLRAYIQNLQQRAQQTAPAAAPAAGKPPAESIDFSKWGPVTKKPLSSLRRTIGLKMQESWQVVPHVTQFDEADITDLMALRKKYNPAYEKKGGSLTVTVLLLKSLVQALKKYPGVNSSLDETSGELVLKNYYHFGIAVDTEQGLIVPVLKDVDKKSVLALSTELAELAEKTRQRKISLEELQGGTFTISNLGSIGGQQFTPIVSKPQAAILGVARGILKPVVREGKIETRMMLPLALSYDHRIIDGADGARFIREVVTGLENPNEKDFAIGK